MASKECQHMQRQITQLSKDLQNIVMALIELKVFKIKIDENGKPVYDTGKDDKPEVQ